MNIKNILNYFKTEEEIRESMSLKDIVPILKQNLVEIKEKDESVIFKVIRIKKGGFQVKVKGIFAFVPFSLMPWKYHLGIWNLMEREVVEHKFFAKIAELDLTLNRIVLDATVTEFDIFYLIDGQTYKAIILKKAKTYILVELGHRYQWNYGSQAFYIKLDNSNLTEIDYYSFSLGDELELTYIQSANNWKKINFEKNIPTSQPISTLNEYNAYETNAENELKKLQIKYDKLFEQYSLLLNKIKAADLDNKE